MSKYHHHLSSSDISEISATTRARAHTHTSTAHSRLKHTHAHTHTREREREREIMIADAFFSFLNWLRLLFFNREMELALIGAKLCWDFYGEKCLSYIVPFLLLLLL